MVAEGVGDCAQVIIFQLVCRSISMKEYSKIGEKKKNMSCYIVEMEIGYKKNLACSWGTAVSL